MINTKIDEYEKYEVEKDNTLNINSMRSL